MADMEVAARRPERWDAPLDAAMGDVDVDRLLEIEPFRSIDPRSFPPSLPLREILKNDARIVRYPAGSIIVREGDYGSSAFLILRGRVRVVLSSLPPETLGRELPHKLTWWQTLRRVLGRSHGVETRERSALPRSAARRAAEGGAQTGNPSPGPSLQGRAKQRDEPRVFLQDVPRVLDENDTVVLEAGELFGELAALTRSPRSATVFAEDDAALVEIRWQGLRDLMRRTDALRLHIERLYRENSLRVHLRETPLLADLPAEQLAAVADATVFESHGEFDWHAAYESFVRRRPGDAIVDEPLIAEEGLPASGLILIRSGFARLSHHYGHGHRTVAYLGRGKVVGLAETIEGSAAGRPAPWTYSLRALGYVDVLRIPQEALDQHVFPHVPPAALEKLLGDLRGPSAPWAAAPGRQSARIAAGPPSDPQLDQGLVEFLVDRRLINGQEAMVIDLDRCTRCDDCVRACAATHDNNPRFIRQGPRHDRLMVAQACMHCIDPVCMIGCPTGAIGRAPVTGVVRINDRTCIGCGTCAVSCPYDNIQMVEIRDRRGAVLTDAATHQPLAKATKCDLCADLPGGPACQRACPHDALVRIDLSSVGDLAAWLNR